MIEQLHYLNNLYDRHTELNLHKMYHLNNDLTMPNSTQQRLRPLCLRN